MGKREKENNTFLKKKSEEKQSSTTAMISVDGKRTDFRMKLKLQGGSFEKAY